MPRTEPQVRHPTEPYTRYRGKLQLGDGPDRRGEVTVEIVREQPSTPTLEEVLVELPGGTDAVAKVPADHRTFAEFYHALERAEGSLRMRLGLEDGGRP